MYMCPKCKKEVDSDVELCERCHIGIVIVESEFDADFSHEYNSDAF